MLCSIIVARKVIAKSQAATKAKRSTNAPTNRGAVYRIQEAAQIAGVSPTTVRVWERNGLLNAYRGSNSYRYFNEADLQRLRQIAHLRKVDKLNIEGIRRALEDSDTDAPVPRRPPGSDSTLGPRLRKLRQDAGMTLTQAAELAELSASFLSALERDQTGVSSESLHRLAHAYGSTVSAVLRSDTAELVQLTSEGKRPVTTVEGGTVSPLINGQTMLDAEIVVIEAGANTGPNVHEGEEVLYVLDGELDVRLGNGQRFKVRTGESLFYPTTIEHEWSNTGASPVRFLWVATPPTW
jgi:DNA-binding transcriptional MerR regulator/quercetin dioxygenase-like cupin family protein